MAVTWLLAGMMCFHILQRCVCVAGRRVKEKRGTDGAGEEVRLRWHPVQCLVRTVCSPLVYVQPYFAVHQDRSPVSREEDVILALKPLWCPNCCCFHNTVTELGLYNLMLYL